jgi:Nucleotidyl transferase AbiEii toxin, Type IV TA system
MLRLSVERKAVRLPSGFCDAERVHQSVSRISPPFTVHTGFSKKKFSVRKRVFFSVDGLSVECENEAELHLACKLEAQPPARMDKAIHAALLKNDSIANQLDLSFAGQGPRKTIRIKLEIDVNPPLGSGEATSFLDFPLDYEVRHQDLQSNFALKIHALLCRGFLKGRDWFDFSWYVSRDVVPNLALLRNALIQKGPWEGDTTISVDIGWLKAALSSTIAKIDWKEAGDDVARFLRPAELRSVELWSERFFMAKLEKLASSESG